MKRQWIVIGFVLVLAGMLNACAHKQEPDALAGPNVLEQARARAASQQAQQPAAPARAASQSASSQQYIK